MEPQTLACRIGAGLSTSESAWEAATEAAREAGGGALAAADVDLAFIFLSPMHRVEARAAAEAVREELAPGHLLGCVAEGVVARVRELERVRRWPSGRARCRELRSSASTPRPCRRTTGLRRWASPSSTTRGSSRCSSIPSRSRSGRS